MAGGSNKKKYNKVKSRRPTKSTSLFVEGGVLSDWSPMTDSPSSRGKSNNSNKSGNTSNNSKKKTETRFLSGNSGGKSKASTSTSNFVESQKPKLNAVGFNYNYSAVDPAQACSLPNEGIDGDSKLDKSHPIVLIDSKESKIVAYVDDMVQTPVLGSDKVTYTYEYAASFEVDESSHRGLGFFNEAEENPSVVEESPVIEKIDGSDFDLSTEEMETDGSCGRVAHTLMNDDALQLEFSPSPEKNSGFLSIGGMKLYTQDLSDEEDDENGEDDEDDEESLDSSDSRDSSDSSDSDGLYNSDSDIDDEVAKDYFEGIGGSYDIANVDQLIGQVLDSSDDEDEQHISGGQYNETMKRLGGIALQEASREYGMKKPRSRGKNQVSSSKYISATDDWSAVDDLMLVKNSRFLYGKKKYAAKLPQSWPSKAEKSKNLRRIPGEKKKRRQEMIASKRRERMISRGVDLEQINSKLEKMVLDKGDIISFQLMHSRDCSQVQKLASIYRLHSTSQGSGKRRFVTVTRTEHTSMPLSSDRARLEKLLGVGDVDADFAVTGTTPGKTASHRSKKASKGITSGLNSVDLKSAKTKTSGESSKKKWRDRDKTGSYAAQPMSFISSGTMVSETVQTTILDETSNENKPIASSSNYGAFEMHTTGFGSRMMAKMGYVEGGLGKDGRGIAEPIEVIQRPKSLGLGATVPETSNMSMPVNTTPPQRSNRSIGQSSRSSESKGKSADAQFGSFEKHTKGFGSKMMAKMGFVEGMGLGRDAQGIVTPLTASRLPKSRGLGAKG